MSFLMWSLMTITTVGYELSPKSFLGKEQFSTRPFEDVSSGKLIGGCCALSGVFILTLPIPIGIDKGLPSNSLTTISSSRQQLCLILQEQIVAQRGGAQEEGDDQADDGAQEGDAEGNAVVDLREDGRG